MNEVMDAVASLASRLALSYALPLWAKGVERVQGWGPMLEVIREMPCDEDFMKWDTNVRRDFLRKWYHTRSKRVQTVSLEERMEDEDSGIHSLPDPVGVAFLRLWGLYLFPWASWLGGRLALHSIAEVGGFVSVKENK